MDELTLSVPASLVEGLPEDSVDTRQDLQQAVSAWERRLNDLIETTDDSDLDAELVDALEHFEERYEQYDDYVVELRAWGQSPIYAMTWRNLYASLVRQLFEHEALADRLNRERHARIVEDGIRS